MFSVVSITIALSPDLKKPQGRQMFQIVQTLRSRDSCDFRPSADGGERRKEKASPAESPFRHGTQSLSAAQLPSRGAQHREHPALLMG